MKNIEKSNHHNQSTQIDHPAKTNSVTIVFVFFRGFFRMQEDGYFRNHIDWALKVIKIINLSGDFLVNIISLEAFVARFLILTQFLYGIA